MRKTFQHRNIILFLVVCFLVFCGVGVLLFEGEASVCMHCEKPNKCNFSFTRSVTFLEQQRSCAYMVATVSLFHLGPSKMYIMEQTDLLQIDVDDSDSEVEQEDEYEAYSE